MVEKPHFQKTKPASFFQGTIIDRIDYNIEHAHIRVEEGLKQLKKAEQYQKTDRKMHCIVVLAVIVVILLVILIATKTWLADAIWRRIYAYYFAFYKLLDAFHIKTHDVCVEERLDKKRTAAFTWRH